MCKYFKILKETSLENTELTIAPKYEIKQKPLGQPADCILFIPGQRLDLLFSYCFPLFPRLMEPYLEVSLSGLQLSEGHDGDIAVSTTYKFKTLYYLNFPKREYNHTPLKVGKVFMT